MEVIDNSQQITYQPYSPPTSHHRIFLNNRQIMISIQYHSPTKGKQSSVRKVTPEMELSELYEGTIEKPLQQPSLHYYNKSTEQIKNKLLEQYEQFHADMFVGKLKGKQNKLKVFSSSSRKKYQKGQQRGTIVPIRTIDFSVHMNKNKQMKMNRQTIGNHVNDATRLSAVQLSNKLIDNRKIKVVLSKRDGQNTQKKQPKKEDSVSVRKNNHLNENYITPKRNKKKGLSVYSSTSSKGRKLSTVNRQGEIKLCAVMPTTHVEPIPIRTTPNEHKLMTQIKPKLPRHNSTTKLPQDLKLKKVQGQRIVLSKISR